LAEQSIARDPAADLAKGALREAKLLGEELPARHRAGGIAQARARRFQRAQVALAGEKHRLAGAPGPSCGFEDAPTQRVQSLASLGGHSKHSGGKRAAL